MGAKRTFKTTPNKQTQAMVNLYTKKQLWYGIFLIFVGLTGLNNILYAQPGVCNGGGCTGGTSWGVVQSTTSNTFVPAVGITFAGEYNTYNVTAGQTYEWSLCTADGALNPTGDATLTLQNSSGGIICYSDDVCGLAPKILWTATFTGQVRVLVAQWILFLGGCNSNTNSHTVVWRCVTCGSGGFNPCLSNPNISACGVSTTANIATGSGLYNPPTTTCGFNTPGQEQIYTFTPSVSGLHQIAQTSSFGYIDYFFKPVSGGCSGTGWTCIQDLIGTNVSSTGTFNLTAGVQYYILLDPETTLGGSVNFSIQCPVVCTYTVPFSGSNSITTCSGNICDHGGTGNYSNSANGFTIINPSVSGSLVRLTFNSFSTESGFDFVTVYDGAGTGGTVLFGPSSGSGLPPVITSLSGPLTILFTSDGSVIGAGFNATITCISSPAPTVTGFSPTGGCIGTQVTITGTNFTGATQVRFNGVLAAFTVVNSTTITATVPAGASSGLISVTNASGTGSSANAFTVNTTPIVSAGSNTTICPGTSTTLNGSASGAPPISYSWSPTTGLSNPNIANPVASPTVTTTYTLTATSNGCSASSSVTIFVQDNQPPAITCPGNQTLTVFPNTCFSSIFYGAPVGTDNCPNPVTQQISGVASGGIFPLGTTTNTFLVTDAAGLTAQCSFNVTVTDNFPPVANCQNVTVQINPGGTASVTGAQVNNSSTDNCSVASTTIIAGTTNYTCANVGGVFTVTLRVTDSSGNTATCNANVTVTDPNSNCCAAPQAFCQLAPVLQLSPAGTATLTPAVVNNGSTAPCGLQSLTVTPTNFNCTHVGTPQLITLTITDINNASSSCQTNLTVVDVTPPLVNCQNTSVILSGSTASITTSSVYASGSDNCNVFNLVSVSPSTFTCANVGNNTVTLTVNDGKGNTATCSANVQVNDFTPPTVTCKNITVNLSGTSVTLTPMAVYDSGADNCGTVNLISVSPSTLTCAQLGFSMVTLTVNDGNGNNANCNAFVNLIDITPPVFTSCPTNFTVGADAQCIAIATWTEPVVSDNCSATLQQTEGSANGDFFGFGESTVTYVATDPSGSTAQCSFMVTVADITPPTVVCYPNLTVQLNSGTAGLAPGNLFFFGNDNCGSVFLESLSQSTFGCADVGTVTVVLTANDGLGNTATCSSQVAVTDNNLPVALCKNISVNLASNGAVSIAENAVDNGSFDLCGSITFDTNITNFTCSNVGSNTVVLTVQDNSGNTATCSATVTVNDITPPVAQCQNITIPLNSAGNAVANAAAVNNGSSDACGIANLTLNQTNFTCADVNGNPHTVTLTVTDANNNTATCSATVTVLDNTPPTITCPDNISQNNDPGVCGAVVNFSPTVSDNCTYNVLAVPASGSLFSIGFTTVEITATDASGNTATCDFMVRVNDVEPPVVTCPENLTQNTDAGLCSAVVNFTPTGSDNCSFGISSNPASGSVFGVGTTTVTATATDASGNTATCNFTVTVNDTQAPSITCPENIVQNTDAGLCSAVVNFTPTGSDNCSFGISANPASGSVFAVGTTTVTATATDASGNTATCNFTVTVNDTQAPTVTCPENIVQSTDAGLCSAVVNFTPTGSDNCSFGISSNPASGAVFGVGATTVTATATDASGNTATCNFTVTVNDTQAPSITCPDNLTQNTDSGLCTAVVNFTPTGSDNCSFGISSNPASGSVFGVGTTTVTATATDASGNTATCNFTVTVNDTQAPTVTCPENIVQSTDAGLCSAVVNFTPTGSDNCSFGISANPASGSVFGVGTTTVTATATDASGNTATCNFTVTVNDTQAPSITCPENLTQNTDAGLCSAVVNFTPTGSDNCSFGISANPASGSVFGVGTTTVTATATDASGNTTTCNFTVTVNDTQAPSIT